MAMSEEEIYAGLLNVFRETFGPGVTTISSRTTARDVKGWDSFNHLNLILALESRFQVAFPNEFLKTMTNVGDIVQQIKTLTSAAR